MLRLVSWGGAIVGSRYRSRDRGSYEGPREDSEDAELAPGRRTLTSQLRPFSSRLTTPVQADAPTNPNARDLEERDHWLNKFGIDIAQPGAPSIEQTRSLDGVAFPAAHAN